MVNIVELVGGQAALLREKDLLFRRRLTELQSAYGGGARLAAELDELEAADRAFSNRVAAYDWQAFLKVQAARLKQAFVEESPVVGGDGRIVYYFDLERAEIGMRGRGVGAGSGARRARIFGRREVVLDLAAVFDELVGGGQHTSRVYPIVFSHDAERNRRLIVASVMVALLGPELGQGVVLEIVVSAAGEVLKELVVGQNLAVSAVELGFGGEREIVRQLDEYVAVDSEANYRHFLKHRQVGAVERRDFVEPFGRMRSLRFERGRCEVEVLGKERPILTIKRAIRLLDSAPVEGRVENFEDEAAADARYLALVEGLIGEGFRQVYEGVWDELGEIIAESGDVMHWETVVS